MRVSTDNWSTRLRKGALDLGLYGHQDYRPFVILGRSRVGSNLLRGLLNAHPEVAAFGEIFRDSSSFDWDHIGYFQSARMRALMQRDPVRFVDSKLLGRYPTFLHAVGFKLFYYHARTGAEAAIWPYLRERREVRIIHLQRRNLLQTHLSRKRAVMTGRWVETAKTVPANGSSTRSPAITLDYEECLDDFVRTRAWEDECTRFFSGHPILELTFEALADDYRSEAMRIQQFLGVETRQLDPATVRQTAQPLPALIANYAELKGRFAGTPWLEFFTD